MLRQCPAGNGGNETAYESKCYCSSCELGVQLHLNFWQAGVPPALGVKGAALATVISRFAELAVVAFVAHSNPVAFPFFLLGFTALLRSEKR